MAVSRRGVLQMVSGGVMAGALGPGLMAVLMTSGAEAHARRHAHKPARPQAGALLEPAILKTWPLAVQLWTVNDQLKADIPGTLARLKALGYEGVETAGLLGHRAAQWRRWIEDAGLTCLSAHVSGGDLIDNFDAKLADIVALGVKWMVVSSPKPPAPLKAGTDWLSGMRDAMTIEAWKVNAAALAQRIEAVHKAGLQLAYHNHFMEFIDHDGQTGFGLIAATHPKLRLEVDLGWAWVGGADPVAVVDRYGAQIDLVHIKDMVKDPTQPIGFRSVEVGKGEIDWKPVLAAAKRHGVSYGFIEQEPPYVRDVFESLSMSRDYLTAL